MPYTPERDENGNLTNPVTLPEYETRLAAAHNNADQAAIDKITAEYHDAREQVAKDAERDEQEQADARSANASTDASAQARSGVVDDANSAPSATVEPQADGSIVIDGVSYTRASA